MEKKASVAMTLVIASMGVTGCSSAEGEQTAAGAETPGAFSDGEETPQAFVFESGTLEIGDFDPQALGDDLFDPCTEISAAEFAAAGFENVEPMPEEMKGLNPGISACFFTKNPDVMVESLNNNNAGRSQLEAQGLILNEYHSEILPTMFVYGPKSGGRSACFAQVDTELGGLVSVAGGASDELEAFCHLAVENLESLYFSVSNK
ncbi:hypothetical protein A0K93_03325 [Corynebacterium sp. BCW_4722]|nr:hypothetical protein A0K93_03325 [Corynebacterium sp. BCW_4722]